MSEYRNLEILGVGKEPGGRFGKVLIAGSGKIVGDVECEEFSIPGSGKVEDGSLTVHGPISCYGAGKVEGSVRAESLSVYGAFSAEGECEIRGDAEVTGSFKNEGPCSVGGSAKITGTWKTEGIPRPAGPGFRGAEIRGLHPGRGARRLRRAEGGGRRTGGALPGFGTRDH